MLVHIISFVKYCNIFCLLLHKREDKNCILLFQWEMSGGGCLRITPNFISNSNVIYTIFACCFYHRSINVEFAECRIIKSDRPLQKMRYYLVGIIILQPLLSILQPIIKCIYVCIKGGILKKVADMGEKSCSP